MRQAADASSYTPRTGRAHPYCVSLSRNHAQNNSLIGDPIPLPPALLCERFTSTTGWDDPTRLYVCPPTTPVDDDTAIITTQCTTCQYPRRKYEPSRARKPAPTRVGIRTHLRGRAPNTPYPSATRSERAAQPRGMNSGTSNSTPALPPRRSRSRRPLVRCTRGSPAGSSRRPRPERRPERSCS